MGKIVPYVQPPRTIVPGEPLFFATAQPLQGGAVGLLVESHMGRPTKIEGNPEHPASRGTTSVYHQASILTLYDPDPLENRVVRFSGRTTASLDRGTAAILRAVAAEGQRTQERRRGGADPQRADSVAHARQRARHS